MSLDQPDTIDALGTEDATGQVVLTLIDGWDWSDEDAHLLALQNKLNAYFGFVETGQISEIEPARHDAGVAIDIISRHVPTNRALALLQTAEFVARPLGIKITNRIYDGGGSFENGS